MRRRGGTVTNVVSGIVLLGLLGLGVWWVIKGLGQAGQQYTGAMIQAKDDSTVIKCQMNLRSVWQVLQAHVAAEGAYPETRQDLGDLCGDSRLLRCPDSNGEDYVYLPPRRVDAAAPQIVLYEPKAVHGGRSCVLFSDGRIVLLGPEEVKGALVAVPPR